VSSILRNTVKTTVLHLYTWSYFAYVRHAVNTSLYARRFLPETYGLTEAKHGHVFGSIKKIIINADLNFRPMFVIAAAMRFAQWLA
jgi:hypothetical protein